jgi:predicted AlkP superfamily phosphohydrolase/phosphomutase
MSERPHRVLLIGLDAADSEILIEACDEGLLPNLAKLRDSSAWGIAEAPPGFGSGAIWPSFSSGVSPASHGRYFYRQVWPGQYEAERFEARHFHGKMIWDVLSDAGKRVAVFDVPKAGVSEGLNGLHVADWLVHGPVYKKVVASPAALAAELRERYTDPEPQCDRPGGRDAAGHVAFRDLCIERVGVKEQGSRHYFAQEPWDLFVTVFGDPHCVGHQAWHVRDPSHPLHDADVSKRVGDPVLQVYTAIDASIGRMLEDVDDDTLVVFFSGTGMGPNYTGNYVLDEMLRRLEGKTKTRSLDWLGRAKRRAKRVLPVELRRRWRRASRRFEERVAHGDRERRRLFTVPHNDISGAIRVNLQGREPEGLVRPEELDALYESLRRDLLSVRNLDTGRAVVKDVVRVADHCRGEYIADMPDFFVLWNREEPIERVGSAKIGEIAYLHRGNRTGDHASESLFMARGRGIQPGRIGPISIMDFAPTIAAICDVPVRRTDGRVVPELVPGESARDDLPNERAAGA